MYSVTDVSLCPDNAAIWSHINGWEVVTSVSVISAMWAAVSVARFYFMVEISKQGRRHKRKGLGDNG